MNYRYLVRNTSPDFPAIALFETKEEAEAQRDMSNEAMKPEYQTWVVLQLVPVEN